LSEHLKCKPVECWTAVFLTTYMYVRVFFRRRPPRSWGQHF